MRTVTVSSYAADTNLNEDVCLDTFGVVVEEIENKIEELKETFKTNKPQACVALNKYVIEKKLKLETCYDKSLLFLYLDSYDNIGDIIKECANQSQNLGDTGKQIKENSEPGPGIENLCKENDQCNPKSAKPKNPTEPSESTAVAEPGSPVKGHSHNLEEKSKIADIDSEPGLSSTFHADPIQTDTEISGLQADLSGKSLPLEGQPKSPLVEDNSSSGEAESSTRGFPDDKQLLTEKTPVLQDTIDANPREAHAKESSRGDSDIKTLRSLSNSEDSSAIPPPFVSGIVENTGVGSDHVKSVTRNVGNASDGVLSADGKVAIIVTPESAVSVEKHSAAGSSVDRRFGTGNIHSEDTCGDSNGKSICKPDAREATICVNHGTEACRSETGGSETLVGASHDVHSPSFQGIPENASYTQKYSKDSPTRAGHLPKAQTEVANQVYSTEVRLNQRDLDGQQFQNKGQYSHSYQLIQSQDSAIASGIGQAQDTLNARSFSSGTIQEGKFNLKRTEDTSETDISIYNIIDGTIGRYIRELPIRTYIITAFLPFVIFLLWKFLIKYTPLSILVDKKKKKKRKKMNARLERILLDPSYQREKNIPLAYRPYEYYTY